MALLMQTLVLQRLVNETARCRRLCADIATLGSAGAFAGALLRSAIQRAEYATASADPAAMNRSLAELEAFEDVRPMPAPPAVATGARAATARPAVAARPAWH